MTWVIGRPGPFGYAVGLSDIRVTLSDGTEKDCLQKIYNVGPHIALGFAGSVAIGFEIVNQLAAVLPPPPQEGLSLIPQVVVEGIARGTPELFRAFPEHERKLGSQLILLSAHPTENDGSAPWAKCYVYRFSAPDFQPVIAGPSEIVSIGSGSNVDVYKKALYNLQKDFNHLTLQQYHRDGAALGMMISISSELKKHTVKGISQHLHICIVGRDGIRIGQNDTRVDEAPEESFRMPPVATSLEELEMMLSAEGISSVDGTRC
jgi:hypothetical protein